MLPTTAFLVLKCIHVKHNLWEQDGSGSENMAP